MIQLINKEDGRIRWPFNSKMIKFYSIRMPWVFSFETIKLES